VNHCLLCLDEMRCAYFRRVSCLLTKGDACCVPVSPLSQLKETLVVNPRLLCLDERANFWGPLVSIINRLLYFCYIGEMFVIAILNEARYSLICFCNEL
jgi:hypothetical protein